MFAKAYENTTETRIPNLPRWDTVHPTPVAPDGECRSTAPVVLAVVGAVLGLLADGWLGMAAIGSLFGFIASWVTVSVKTN